MDINADVFKANDRSQSFYNQSREPGSPDNFTYTISTRNRNVRIIKNFGDESKKKARDTPTEKFLENDKKNVLNFFLNPNFNDIKCKYNT